MTLLLPFPELCPYILSCDLSLLCLMESCWPVVFWSEISCIFIFWTTICMQVTTNYVFMFSGLNSSLSSSPPQTILGSIIQPYLINSSTGTSTSTYPKENLASFLKTYSSLLLQISVTDMVISSPSCLCQKLVSFLTPTSNQWLKPKKINY